MSRRGKGGADELDRATWQVCSALLAYPDSEVLAQLPELRSIADRLPAGSAEPLSRFADAVAAMAPTELAEHYVEVFDHRRRCCLYLTYYAHGDTRKRGMALLEFKTAYRRAGLELGPEELPDHLAVVLEYAGLDAAGGRALLLAHRAGVELLRLALEDAGSPYADVLRAVTATLPPLAGEEREAVRRLAAQGPPAEEVGLAPFAPPDVMPPSGLPQAPVPLPFPTTRPPQPAGGSPR